ncbi:MAG: hypothetical protein ACFFEJ_11550 [Candidatus Thorarchaeota archaeon]
MAEKKERKTLLSTLKAVARDLNHDQFMIMEYLGPIVDGSRAALSLSIEKARELHQISEAEFEAFMDTTEQSFLDLTICFQANDIEATHSLVFDSSEAYIFEDCVEPDVIISGTERLLMNLFDADSDVDPIEELGQGYGIAGNDSGNIIEALGLLCYTPLLRIARSGVDPSSLLSEDADAIILVSASDLVTKIVRRWIDVQLANADD